MSPPRAFGEAPLDESRTLETRLLRADNLSRSFGETRALRSCTFDLTAGETHAIVGENGSGKSTLVKILSGVIPPDSGSITFKSRTWKSLRTPHTARGAGIATVFQEILVVEGRSILENVWLGADGMFLRRLSEREKGRLAREIFGELTDQRVDLSQPIRDVDLSVRQLCVIARALVQNPQLLILDESTAALDISDRDRLFDAVRRRCASGTGVIFISHRMDEIEEIADRITVLRSGESVSTLDRADATPAVLVRLMSGRELEAERRRAEATAEAVSAESEPTLRVSGLRLKRETEPIDLEVRSGEIVGVAGLEGHGQVSFLQALVGLERPVSGTVVRETARGPRQIRSLRQAVRHGIAYVPRDRATEGIFGPLSIVANFSLPLLPRFARLGLVLQSRLRAAWQQYAAQLKIKFGRGRNRITTLSGGNQQKVVIARWLAARPEVLVLNDPTRGVDLATKEDIYALFRQIAGQGVAIILLSSEVSELVTLVDRTLVFREHGLFAVLDHAETTRERIVAAMFGRRE